MAKSHDKLAQRLSNIIMKFNNGERFTIDELADEFNVSTRTIYRDINERLHYLPFIHENEYYSLEPYALGKLSFEDIKNFATLSGIKDLYPSLSKQFITDILNTKLNNTYLINNQGFEDISDKQKSFEILSAAIVKTSPITFVYNNKPRLVNPYKLINNDGIWYVLADENGKLKTFTFSNIKNLQWKNDDITFTPNKAFLNHISKEETNWFTSEKLIDVKLQIDNSAKEYFTRKQILSNYTILDEYDEYFIISTKIGFEDEILKLVRYWIPYVKIIEPRYMKDKLYQSLQEYMQ